MPIEGDVQAVVEDNKGKFSKFVTNADDRAKLWKARHNAWYGMYCMVY